MQLRYETGLAGEEYVRARAWRDASLERCPNHPHGGCSLARHGTYARKSPRGTKIARWYCPQSHTTFSLLPDCLAARLPGALRWVERRVRLVHSVLSIVIGLLPEQLARCVGEVGAVRARLKTETALRALRTLVAEQLPVLPAPLGFHPHGLGATNHKRSLQHKMGSDPPPAPA